LWKSNDVFELIDEVRDDASFSCWGVEDDWWTSEVGGWYSGTIGIVAVVGDFSISDDVFAFIDEVRDDGWCSSEGVEGDWWISEVGGW